MSTPSHPARGNANVNKDIDEEIDEQKRVLEAINEKTKDNLPLKLKLLALYNYTQTKSQQDDQMDKENDVVSHSYKKKSLPLITQINDVVNGKKLQEEDIKGYEQFFDNGADEKKKEALESTQPIEGYWLQVFKNSLIMKEEVQPHDEEPIKALKKIELTTSEDPTKPHDFTLKFFFGPNDYFTNEVIIKEFTMKEQFSALKTECTEIKWKEGKNITKKMAQKKQKNKKTGSTRTVTKEVDQESFFTFFRNVEAKEEEVQEEDDSEDEEESDNIVRHTDMGLTIVEELLPYSNEYYLGVRNESRFSDFGPHGGEYDDFDGDDDDDDEDDDEDVDEDDVHRRRKGKKGKDIIGGDPKQECKQQ